MNYRLITTSIALVATMALGVGCSKKSDDAAAPDTALTISGTLGTASASSVSNKIGHYKPGDDMSTMAVTLTDLEIYVVCFSSPPVIAQANVGSDGSFSVSLPGAKGSACTAVFRDKTDGGQVGTVVFQDTESTDLNGDSESSSIVLSGSVTFGAITLSSDGKIKIPITQIKSVLGSSESIAAGTAFDPTGTWYIKAYDGTLPTGYATVAAAGQDNHGPTVNFPITMVRFAGKNFTAGASCTKDPISCPESSGTVGDNDRYALSIWGGSYAQGIGACGGKSGFTQDEARAYAGLNLTSAPTVEGNAMSFGPYGYSTSITGFGGDAAPFNKIWMKTGAILNHDLQDCRPTAVVSGSTTYRGWACKAAVRSGDWPGVDSGTSGWQVGVEGGGCFNTTTGKPVNVTNWSSMGGSGTCTSTDVSATYGTGFTTWTCAYTNVDYSSDSTTANADITCKHTGGQFTDNSGVPSATPISMSNGQYLGQPTTIASQGATCASIGSSTTAHTLAAYRCYAEALWSGNQTDKDNLSNAACLREYRFNWAATTAADFAQDDERGKPKQAFITNILKYSTDGGTATLEDEQKEKITVQTGSNSSTFCEISRRTVLSFKKVSDSRVLVDLKEGGQMNSTDAACLGAAKEALAKTSGDRLAEELKPTKMIFYVDKTL